MPLEDTALLLLFLWKSPVPVAGDGLCDIHVVALLHCTALRRNFTKMDCFVLQPTTLPSSVPPTHVYQHNATSCG